MWKRQGTPPDVYKLTLVVNKQDYPELAEWLWQLPWRKSAGTIRDILSAAVINSGSATVSTPAEIKLAVSNNQSVVMPVAEIPPQQRIMSDAVSDILNSMGSNFK